MPRSPLSLSLSLSPRRRGCLTSRLSHTLHPSCRCSRPLSAKAVDRSWAGLKGARERPRVKNTDLGRRLVVRERERGSDRNQVWRALDWFDEPEVITGVVFLFLHDLELSLSPSPNHSRVLFVRRKPPPPHPTSVGSHVRVDTEQKQLVLLFFWNVGCSGQRNASFFF